LAGLTTNSPCKQHEAYCAALEQCGLSLIRLEPDPDYPDSTFVEDVTSWLLRSLTVRLAPSAAILTRPGAASRAGEVESMRKPLADFFLQVSEIESPELWTVATFARLANTSLSASLNGPTGLAPVNWRRFWDSSVTLRACRNWD
jgi:hypothetical protein